MRQLLHIAHLPLRATARRSIHTATLCSIQRPGHHWEAERHSFSFLTMLLSFVVACSGRGQYTNTSHLAEETRVASHFDLASEGRPGSQCVASEYSQPLRLRPSIARYLKPHCMTAGITRWTASCLRLGNKRHSRHSQHLFDGS